MKFKEAHDKTVLYGVVGFIATLPLLAAFAHRGYGAAMLLIGTLIAMQPHVWRAGFRRFLRRPDRHDLAAIAVWSFAAFSTWLLLSGLWSEVRRPWKVWSDFTFVVLATGALVFEILRRAENDPRGFRLIAGAFLLSVAGSAVLLALEAVTGGALRAALPPNDPAVAHVKDLISLARGLSAVIPSLFAAAAVALLWRRKLDLAARISIGGGFALAALSAALFSVTANTAALIAGALAYLAAVYAPKTTLRALGVFVALVIASAPFAARLPASELAAATHLEASWAQRLFIFRKGGEAAIACAPFGCGADYGRALSQNQETAAIPGIAEKLPVMPLHPHNVFLQVWMDLGVPGAFFFAAAALYGFLGLARLDGPRVFSAAAAAAAASLLVSALIEASLWQNWRVAAAGFAAAGLALSFAFHRLHLNSAERRTTE